MLFDSDGDDFSPGAEPGHRKNNLMRCVFGRVLASFCHRLPPDGFSLCFLLLNLIDEQTASSKALKQP